jgi:hypothetical protein
MNGIGESESAHGSAGYFEGSGIAKSIDGSDIAESIDGSGIAESIDGSGIAESIDGSNVQESENKLISKHKKYYEKNKAKILAKKKQKVKKSLE